MNPDNATLRVRLLPPMDLHGTSAERLRWVEERVALYRPLNHYSDN